MKRTTLFIILFIAVVVVIFIIPNPARFDYLKGQYRVEDFLYKNVSDTSMQGKVLLIDNLSSGINVGDLYNEEGEQNKVLVGKYKFEEDNGKTVMVVSNSKTPYLNGIYSVRIDTLEYNKKVHNFKMTFSSSLVTIIGLNSTTYLDF